MRRLRILTWHTHGSYLFYLSHIRHDIYIVTKPGRPAGYGGRCGPFPWGPNVHEVDTASLARQHFDCVLYQDDHQFLEDRHSLLSPAQARLPSIYLEHDPPRAHPTDTRHFVEDSVNLLVHVTAFNALMWDSGRSTVRVIEHGVPAPDVNPYSGEKPCGIVLVNRLARRGRRLGADLFVQLRARLPLDLFGMEAQQLGGVGELPHAELAASIAHYRFFFHPARYTSLGLAVLEAMMCGLPVIGLATTELVTVIDNGRSGYLDNRPEKLSDTMQLLLEEPGLARQLGQGARQTALERFSLARFVDDWHSLLAELCGGPS